MDANEVEKGLPGSVVHLQGPPEVSDYNLQLIAVGLLSPSRQAAQRIAIELCKVKGIQVP